MKRFLIAITVLAFATPAFAQEQPTKADRDKFAKDLATVTSKSVGHPVEATTGGSQSEVLVVRDKAIQQVRAGFGFFGKDVGLQLAADGFREVYLTNGVQWWCNKPVAKSETGWWTFGVGGPFKSGSEAASNLKGLLAAFVAKPKAPALVLGASPQGKWTREQVWSEIYGNGTGFELQSEDLPPARMWLLCGQDGSVNNGRIKFPRHLHPLTAIHFRENDKVVSREAPGRVSHDWMDLEIQDMNLLKSLVGKAFDVEEEDGNLHVYHFPSVDLKPFEGGCK